MYVGWGVCGSPVRVSTGLSVSVYRVPGLYESRQAWLDRQGVAGGWREIHEVCWALADRELERDMEEAVAASMKDKGK